MSSKPGNIGEYIAGFPPDVQAILEKIRAMISAAAPEAKEKISYQMPSFTLEGHFIYFAAFKKHLGIYPPVRGDEKLQQDLLPFRGEKGNLKFPLSAPIPYDLIQRVIQALLQEHQQRLALKRVKKSRPPKIASHA